jgi:hypothetical protein
MPTFPFPAGAVPADIFQRVPLQIVAPSAEPPDGEGWLHEIKHDGDRLLAIVAGGELRLLKHGILPHMSGHWACRCLI